jgi:molybdate transport system substrate-binding protein
VNPKTNLLLAIVITAGAALMGGCGKKDTPAPGAVAADAQVRISAAISLKTALEEVRPMLAKAAGMPVQFNFGSSGGLSAQIMRGAPVDVFISADPADVEALAARKLVAPAPGSSAVLATNQLVLVTPAGVDRIKSLADLGRSDIRKVAVGEPTTVPAGRYARQTLEHEGLWQRLSAGGKLVMGENVAQVMAYVAAGEVDAGLVYRSDVHASGMKARLVLEVPAADHAPIQYVTAVLDEAPQPQAAAAVQRALLTDAMQDILVGHGFGRVPAGMRPVVSPSQP